MARAPIEAPRSAEYKRHEAEWSAKHQRAQEDLKTRFGPEALDVDVYGEPVGGRFEENTDIPGKHVALALERALRATGDPIFRDAMTCLDAYGLAEGSPRRSHEAAREQIFGSHIGDFLEHMRVLIESQHQHAASVRGAAEEVAANYYYRSATFEAAVETLRKAYSKWQKTNFAPFNDIRHHGDCGYSVLVRPIGQNKVPIFGGDTVTFLPQEGIVVKYTAWWRHLFDEGAISIARVG